MRTNITMSEYEELERWRELGRVMERMQYGEREGDFMWPNWARRGSRGIYLDQLALFAKRAAELLALRDPTPEPSTPAEAAP